MPTAFVSIHVNATVSPNTDSTGIEAWISGKKDDARQNNWRLHF